MTSGHRGIRWLQRCILGLVLLGMYAPVAMVFLYSFNESRLGTVWTQFSTRWYAELFRRGDLWGALQTSLLIGLTVSTLSTVLGTVAAIGLQRWGRRPRSGMKETERPPGPLRRRTRHAMWPSSRGSSMRSKLRRAALQRTGCTVAMIGRVR